MKLTIPVSRYNLSVDSSSSVSVECGRTDLISIPASAVIVGKKKRGQNLEIEEKEYVF